MKKNIADKETKEVLSDQEKIKRLTEHEGWGIVKAMFIRKAASLVNMANVNVAAPLGGNLLNEVGMRQLASSKILEVVNEVMGTAEQFDLNSTLTEQIESGYILRNPSRRS